MDNGIEAHVLTMESAIRVIEAIENPVIGGILAHDYYEGRGCYATYVSGDKIAEEYIDYIERGEFVIPAQLKERAAKAIIKFRLDRS
ncbi:MAG: hypothetical protein ABSH25_13190 [Syntrophorhabdales bacterium]|jgi:hypothetical protein